MALVLKAYCDGSGSSSDKNCNLLTLAGLISNEEKWPRFEESWGVVLDKHSAPMSKKGSRYFHCAEAMSRWGGFCGWTEESVRNLLFALQGVLAEGAGDFAVMSCTVKLDDYRRVRQRIQGLRSPERICLNFCLPGFMRLNGSVDKRGIEIYFDKGEKFFDPLYKDWKRKGRGRPRWADLVNQISGKSDMRDIRQIQAADVFAWMANRYYAAGKDDKWGQWFASTFLHSAHGHTFLGEDSLSTIFDADGNYKPSAKLPPTRVLGPDGMTISIGTGDLEDNRRDGHQSNSEPCV
jgi:hypothetical protein